MPSNEKIDLGPVNKFVLKIYHQYEISCNVCKQIYSLKEIEDHEKNCESGKCENPLCTNAVSSLEAPDNLKFVLNGMEKVACCKKCKKVAKFGHLLKKNIDETEILKTFE